MKAAQKINQMSQLIDNNKKEIDSRLKDFSIIDILKDKMGDNNEGNDNSICLELLSNLEKKMLDKFQLIDDKIKLLQDNNMGKTATHNNSVKTTSPIVVQTDENRTSNNITLENKINIDNNPNAVSEDDKKISELQAQIDDLLKQIEKNKEEYTNKGNQYEKQLKELNNNFANSFLQIKTLLEKSNSFTNNEDLNKLKNDVLSKFDSDTRDMRMDVAIQKKSIENLKEQLIKILEDKTDQDELQNLKKRFESIINSMNVLKEMEQKFQTQLNSKPSFDPQKYIDINQFNEYKIGVSKDFSIVNNNIENIKLIIDDLINNIVSNKASFKDLKSLEDSVLSKLEDLKIASMKKFSDKIETGKSFRILEQQIKHYIDSGNKKLERSESWLLAKKPLGGHLCASCEAYIGDLKESTQYVPWNKYPSREPNDKLYRIGTGFSKMLQMVSIEGGGQKEVIDKNASANFNSLQEFYKDNKNEKDVNENNESMIKNEENVNPPINVNKSMGLPKIKGKGKMNLSGEFGKDEVLGDKMEEQYEDEELAKEKPKIMRIFKKSKN